ncbi:MAG TPA: CAP domain-containing protein [Candidatus Saccharimonadales bacterium]|nr:CAP domain-containing protein [Candidatus Saccharimonadales bacterium]
MEGRLVPSAWDELQRTAQAVRVETVFSVGSRPGARLASAVRPALLTAGVLAACGLAALHLAGTTNTASANGGADSTLFSLTNSDRTSNGVHSLLRSGTLASIGENARYNCNGIGVNGRSDDMIQRNYFAHPILGCGQLVFSMMQAFGVHYKSAGENIGWVSNEGSPTAAADYINGAFMNSADHRSNILNPNYTEMGVGSDESASGTTWTGVSPGQQNVWMFSEEFAQVGVAPPPPHRTPKPGSGGRNSPGPGAPGVGPVATAVPAATPIPTATPFVVPAGSLPQDLPAPPIAQYEGLLPNSIESVLEAFLTL